MSRLLPSITCVQWPDIYPWAHSLCTCAHVFIAISIFPVYSNGIGLSYRRIKCWATRVPSSDLDDTGKHFSVRIRAPTHICTMARFSISSYPSLKIIQPPSSSLCYLPPSHQPSNQTSVYLAITFHWIHPQLAMRYSFILSMCHNHLNTLWPALPSNPLSIPALLRTYLYVYICTLFKTHSIRVLQPNFSNTASRADPLFYSRAENIKMDVFFSYSRVLTASSPTSLPQVSTPGLYPRSLC